MGLPKSKRLRTIGKKLISKNNQANQKKRHEKLAAIKETKAKQLRSEKAHRHIPTYHVNEKILLIGEGNFSFARSLIEHFLDHEGTNLTATCYDSEEVLYQKYEDEAKDNVAALQGSGATVLFSVDGTQLQKNKQIRAQKYSKIIFNFPHAGAGIKNQDRNIRANQELVSAFFRSAEPMLEKKKGRDDSSNDGDKQGSGEIYVTMKTCKPYDLWQVRDLGKSNGLSVKRSFVFRSDDYPGYEHRRTLGFKEGVSKPGNEEIAHSQPKTFIFVPREAMQADIQKSLQGARKKKAEMQKAQKKRKHASDDDHSEDDDFNGDDESD